MLSRGVPLSHDEEKNRVLRLFFFYALIVAFA
jgi:hypothetical protein